MYHCYYTGYDICTQTKLLEWSLENIGDAILQMQRRIQKKQKGTFNKTNTKHFFRCFGSNENMQNILQLDSLLGQ